MMQFSDFEFCDEFDCGGKRWRCTDLGQRVVVTVPTDQHDDSSWLNGPPYAIAETVFDEYDIEGCSPVK